MNNDLHVQAITNYSKLIDALKHMQGTVPPELAQTDSRGYDQRKLAVARTNFETAMYWLTDAMNGYRPETGEK